MFDEALCEQGRNFGNKIWNAYRLINGWEVREDKMQTKNNEIAILWFKSVLAKAIEEIDELFTSYRISEAFMRIYKLFWDEFSGWYLEVVKPAYQTPTDRATMDATRYFFDTLMRLIHPFMPFVTEEIWQDLEPRKVGESIMYAQIDKGGAVDEHLMMRFGVVKEIISNVRSIRKAKNIPQRQPITLNFTVDENFPAELAAVIVKMCNLEDISAVQRKSPTAESFMVKTRGRDAEVGEGARLLRGLPCNGYEEALERALRVVGTREGGSYRARQEGRCRG